MKEYQQLIECSCYELIQGFRVTCLLTGQYNPKCYGTITDVISNITSSHVESNRQADRQIFDTVIMFFLDEI